MVYGRIAVAPAEFPIVADMRISLVGLTVDMGLALLAGAGAFRAGSRGAALDAGGATAGSLWA